jgi:hypothetical protein
VITGFNTDIEYDGVTYHVQTEDKGLRTPFILCLIYNRGTILASRRIPYDDLVESGFDEKELARRLQKLHKTVCAAISKGRLEDLKRSSERTSPAASAVTVADVKPAAVVSTAAAAPAGFSDLPVLELPIPMPPDPQLIPKIQKKARTTKHDSRGFNGDPIVPEHVIQIVSDLAGTDRPANNKLSVELIGDTEFCGGQTKSVVVLVCRGSERKVVPDAEIMIKVMGSSFKPLIFHSRSNPFGISSVEIDLPEFREGRAAVVVRVISKGEEVEVRRPLVHGTRS